MSSCNNRDFKAFDLGLRPPPSLEGLRDHLGIPGPRRMGFLESLPFVGDDVTAGAENELQAAILGPSQSVDLPLSVRDSNYFRNIARRVASGDASGGALSDLERFLEDNPGDVWENSWARVPLNRLSAYARAIFEYDLLEDKSRPDGPLRKDADKFVTQHEGTATLRAPVSYLLKLSLAEAVGSQEALPVLIDRTAARLMGHFLNDNTSPETHSFNVVPLIAGEGCGSTLAKETAKRFLFTQLLVMFANKTLLAEREGQRAVVYFSPHPPVRQKELNELISDSFYRELFMSPCLSGWTLGRKKHEYMRLCHETLSRSRLNAVGKLRDAGIITRNLTALPTLSNISPANNGAHVSLGSRKLSACLGDPASGFNAVHEKYIGDLVIKILEHFLCLFVGTYSAAPYRIGFSDFHPEKVLGFLPHELDFTHLRMFWRRWKKKADLKIFGRPLTPFGPTALDKALSAIFRIRGDFVPDFRLLDYPVCLMSTPHSPACNGVLGNETQLKRDLADLGILDADMALYIPYRLRQYDVMGFSGFEGRHYSLFESLGRDMGPAVGLQTLVTALAFKYVFSGAFTHGHIPDDPFVESERRFAFFCAAGGIPTFYVRSDTPNLFMRRLIERTQGVRHSRRYPGYKRAHVSRFQEALLETLMRDGPDLIEHFGLRETMRDARERLASPDRSSALGRLTGGILDRLGESNPLNTPASEFNRAAEAHYRDKLRKIHIEEGLALFEEDLAELARESLQVGPWADALIFATGDREPAQFVASTKERIMDETATPGELRTLINLAVISAARDFAVANGAGKGTCVDETYEPSICGAPHGNGGFRTPLLGWDGAVVVLGGERSCAESIPRDCEPLWEQTSRDDQLRCADPGSR